MMRQLCFIWNLITSADMKVGPKRPKTWQIFSPQVNHWIPLISPYIKSLISTERGLHEGVGWVRLTSHGNMTSCTDGTFTTTPQKSNELIPKMAIFKAGDAFSKAHHFGSPADSFQGRYGSKPSPGVGRHWPHFSFCWPTDRCWRWVFDWLKVSVFFLSCR